MLGEVDRSDDPNYGLFHYRLGNTIEDSITFKKQLKHYHKSRDIVLPNDYLEEQSLSYFKMVLRESHIPLTDREGQEVFLSYTSKKIITNS